MPPDPEQLKRWRLILGQHAQDSLAQMGGAGGCELSPEQIGMDEALAAIYDDPTLDRKIGRQENETDSLQSWDSLVREGLSPHLSVCNLSVFSSFCMTHSHYGP